MRNSRFSEEQIVRVLGRRDYNTVHPHSSLGYRTRTEARRSWTSQATTLPIRGGPSQ